MSNQSLADLLDLVEQRLNEVSVVLADGHPPALQQACEALQQLAIQLMQLLDRRDFAHQRTPAVGLRIKKFATAIADLRAHLIRRAVLVEQRPRQPTVKPAAPTGQLLAKAALSKF
jgi:hypothetical protein